MLFIHKFKIVNVDKMLAYEKNKTLWDVLFLENHQLPSGDSNPVTQ